MLSTRLAARIAEKKERLDGLRPLPPAVLVRLREALEVEWTYHSNAIEGNTLTLRETRLVLDTGLTIGGKSLREHLEAVNHREAIHYVEALVTDAAPITAFHVRQIHQLVLAGIDKANAGRYRSIPVHITGVTFEPPEAWEVPRLMDEWAAWLGQEAPSLGPVGQAAVAHHRLAAVHPFVDGNGRTARLVMNLLLLRDGFPAAVIQRSNRRQYYGALARADRDDPRPLVEMVGRAVDRSLTLYLEAATPSPSPSAPPDAWQPLRNLAEGSPYSQEYLSLLARTGRLEALKRGRVWHSTRQALAAYQDSLGRGVEEA